MNRNIRHVILLLSTILLIPCILSGQTVKRLAGETAEAFARRLMPANMEPAHPAIETNTWDSTAMAVIAFYGYDDSADVNTGYNNIYGHLYLPIGNDNYRDISFGPMEEDGGYPEIISVFFSGALLTAV